MTEPEPAPCHVVEGVSPPPQGLTGSRADLVTWWRWRYSMLGGERARLAALLVQALGEAQSYRQVSQSALDTLHDLTDTTHRQCLTIGHLRDEIRRRREPVKEAAS